MPMTRARHMKRLWQDRDISTLSFNERVLQEAEDERNPLMERVRFLGIHSSNMDEFYAAFDVKEGDKLWRPAAERVKIW